MESDVQRKARLLLAGLAAMPMMAAANPNQIQPNSYCSPYADCQEIPDEQIELTGLTAQELREGRSLVNELNLLDVIKVQELVLTKAPRIPYRYNMPEPTDVEAARLKNLERLAKLRLIVEAAK